MRDILKSMIIGWSIVLAALLFVLGISGTGGHSYLILLTAGEKGISQHSILYLAPIYAFAVWIVGCVFVVVLAWGIKRNVTGIE